MRAVVASTGSGRSLLVWVLGFALLPSGCGGPGDPGKVFEGVRQGMTVEEADAAFGPGQEVAYDQLSDVARVVWPSKEPGVTYRLWVREAGVNKATLFAAFKDGKLMPNGNVVEKTGRVSVRSGGS